MGMNVGDTIGALLLSLKTDDAKLARTEFLVMLVAILMILLFVMDAYRLRSNSSFVRTILLILDTLTNPLLTYTIGLIQNLSFSNKQLTNQFFGLWGVLLYILESGTEYITAYSIMDSSMRRRVELRELVLTFFAGNLNATKGSKFQTYLWVLWSLGPVMIFYKIITYELARNSYSHGQNSKLLAEYMKSEYQQNQQHEPEQPDPITMNGYQYMVRGENQQDIVAQAPSYRVGMKITRKKKFITLESVWNCNGHLLISLDRELKLKDVCLSYALHKLLRCEMDDFSLPSGCRYKTQRLLFEGVLNKKYSDKRIFRIMEMEIAFLNDYSYTRLPVGVWYGYPLLKLVTLLVTLVIASLLAYDVHQTETGEDFHHKIKGQNIDRVITYVLLGLIVLKEMWEMFLYICSDWTKLVIICQYVEDLWLLKNRLAEYIIWLLCRLNLVMRWHNKMTQYSFLESFNYKPSLKKTLHYGTFYMVKKPIEGGKGGKSIKIFDEVKSSIVQALRLITSDGVNLRNGMPCLYKRRVRSNYQSACTQKTCSHLILVWHIATSMCEIQLAEEVRVDNAWWNTLLHKLKVCWSHPNTFLVDPERLQDRTRANYIIANTISCYCASLLISVPELLPDHPDVSKSVFSETVSAAREIIGDCDSVERVLGKLKEIGGKNGPQSDETTSTVYKGARLGTEILLEENQMNTEARWEMLADFWVDLLLYLAPSNMTEDHRCHLVEGGEFITLLWAFFTNCGIFDRTTQEEQVPANDAPSTSDVEQGLQHQPRTSN